MSGTHSESPRKLGVWIIGLSAVAAVVAFAVFCMQTRDVQRVPPHVVGSLWSVRVGDATRICYITREDRAQVRSLDVEGMHTYQHTYSIYLLHARDPRSGAAIASTEIARIDTTKPDIKRNIVRATLSEDPVILGMVDELIWFWNRGLESRSAATLATVCKPANIVAANPSLAAVLPDEQKYAKVSTAFRALVIKSQDARYFKVDAASAKLELVDETQLAAVSTEYTKTAETGFANLAAAGRSLTASTGPAVWCRKALVDDGDWLALLTADERSKLSPRLGSVEDWEYHNWAFTFGESPQAVFRGRYKVTHEPNFARNAMDLEPAGIEPLNGDRLLMAGFLRRPGANHAWTIAEEGAAASSPADRGARQPKAQLVLHRKALGQKQPWFLMKLGRDGKVHWDRSTGLNELDELCDGDGVIVLTGKSASDAEEPRGARPERMLFIRESTGDRATLDITKNELAPVQADQLGASGRQKTVAEARN